MRIGIDKQVSWRKDPPHKSMTQSGLLIILERTLKKAMGPMAGFKRAVMFSGGFDSILIACLAQKNGAKVTAVTVQFEDFNPLTVSGALETASKMGIPHQILHVSSLEFLSAFEDLAVLIDERILDLDLSVVFSALKKYDRTIAGESFISAMGCDQLFGNAGVEGLAAFKLNEKAHQRAAQAAGVKFIFPFLKKSMIDLSLMLPSSMKRDKKLLRAMAVSNSIPSRGSKSEIQVPFIMKQILVKKHGSRAWPHPVSSNREKDAQIDQKLLSIIDGIRLEKSKGRIIR